MKNEYLIEQLTEEYKNLIRLQNEEILKFYERMMKVIDKFKNNDVDKKEFVEDFFEIQELVELREPIRFKDECKEEKNEMDRVISLKIDKFYEKFFSGEVRGYYLNFFSNGSKKSLSDLYKEAIENAETFYDEFVDYVKFIIERHALNYISYAKQIARFWASKRCCSELEAKFGFYNSPNKFFGEYNKLKYYYWFEVKKVSKKCSLSLPIDINKKYSKKVEKLAKQVERLEGEEYKMHWYFDARKGV